MTSRVPGLDGIRGLAILLVLGFHLAEPWWFSGFGNLGVTMFFTLSGFLITGLLLHDLDVHDRVRWGHFYRRRALRLVPAMVVCTSIVCAFQLSAGRGSDLTALPVLGYFSNWAMVSRVDLGWLGHTWSLAVEAQFYLVWPPLLALLAGFRRTALIVALLGIAWSLALRLAVWDGGAGADRAYYSSDTRADALLVGCALALLLDQGAKLSIKPIVPWTALVALSVVVAVSAPSMFINVVTVPGATPWISAGLILLALQRPGVLAHHWFAWWADRSYGIYLWHFPLIRATNEAVHSVPAVLAAGLVGVLLADLSWRFVERPILRSRTPTGA